MYFSKVADRQTFGSPVKTIDGKVMILVATKTSRRTLRKGKTQYIYSMNGADLLLGAGLDVQLTRHLALRGEWEHFAFDESSTDGIWACVLWSF